MDEDLNVGNLLETHAGRGPATQGSEPLPLSYAQKRSKSRPTTALAIAALAALIVVLSVVALSGKSGRRAHVMETY